jgi:hypothetical protein
MMLWQRVRIPIEPLAGPLRDPRCCTLDFRAYFLSRQYLVVNDWAVRNVGDVAMVCAAVTVGCVLFKLRKYICSPSLAHRACHEFSLHKSSVCVPLAGSWGPPSSVL